jgi:phage terminase Nu1 subunit (DNA packaging protein)
MNQTKPTPFSRAFWNQYNIILLSSAGLFSLATGSWLPAMLGGGAELLWLVLGADSERFRGWVEQQEKSNAQALAEKARQALLSQLESIAQERFSRFEAMALQLKQEMEGNKSIEATLLSHESQRLSQLSSSFLEVSLALQKLQRYLREASRDQLRREAQALTESASRERQASVKEGLILNLSMAQKRLSQYDKMLENSRVLETKLLSMESSLQYLRSQLVSAGDVSAWGQELHELLNNVELNEEVAKSIA